MTALLHPIFVALWALFGSMPSLPVTGANQWVVESPWVESGGIWTTSARSEVIPERCRTNPEGYVRLPMVIDGSQTISAGDRLIVTYSDPTFRAIRSTYGRPQLSCRQIGAAQFISWTASTDSKYFSHFSFFPYWQQSLPLDNAFDELLNVVACGTLLVFAVFCFTLFSRAVSLKLALIFAISSVFLSIYFATAAPGLLLIDLSMLISHRIGDASLCLGFLGIYFILETQGLLRARECYVYAVFTCFAVMIEILGSSSDEIQMGTVSIFVPTIIITLVAIIRALKRLYQDYKSGLRWIQIMGLLIFSATFGNDMLVVSDALDSFLLLPIGLVAIIMFLALGVQEEIASTYRERDYLRENLEKEVERKTLELKRTQAELIHSAKLASLGTLSAGIAHEINNSINFVNGAIVPLNRLLAKLQDVSPRDFEKGRKLLDAITDGVNITVNIVRSLRQYTGLNQSKFKDIKIAEVIQSVSTILSSRLKNGSRITVRFDSEIQIYGDVVGVNQILMNLITNALDAMPNGGEITIEGQQREEDVMLHVIDQGSGIPRELTSRVFDPFFTTKDVGEGTGLGLYIIATEMKKHGGSVEVVSTGKEGTTIALTFPLRPIALREAA